MPVMARDRGKECHLMVHPVVAVKARPNRAAIDYVMGRRLPPVLGLNNEVTPLIHLFVSLPTHPR